MGKSQSISIQNYSIAKQYHHKNFPDPGFSKVFINPIENSGIPVLDNGSRTFYESFIRSVQVYPHNAFLGTRQYTSSGILGDYVFKSYSEIYQTTRRLLSSMKRWNLLSKDYNLIAIISKNREEMVVTELTCMCQNIPVVPLPDNLPSDILSSILMESKPKLIFCGKAQCDLLINLPTQSLLSLKSIVVFDNLREPIKNHIKSLGIEIFEYQDIFSSPVEAVPDSPPEPDSLFVIIYTSGTTGDPRGVMITHRNLICSFSCLFKARYIYTETDSYLMYLPHSHIYDRFMFYTLLNVGGQIGFYSGDMLNIKDDLMMLKPTVFITVPRILNRFYDAIKQRFREKKGLSRKIVSMSLISKQHKYETTGNLANGFWENIAFKKVRKSIGGRVRMMISASAPLNGEIMKFLRMVFACPVIEAYGITETSGPCFITQDADTNTGHIGGPMPGIESKLKYIPELCPSSPDNEIGELCIRGSSLFIGYFKGQDVTDKAVDSDGWFYSGDIAERCSRTGAFKIISRISSIVKLSQGEFVPLEKVEKTLMISQFVYQVFVYGDGFHHFLVAIVVPNKEFVMKSWIVNKTTKVQENDYNTIVLSQKLKNEILEDLKDISFRNQLSRSEIICDLAIEAEEWTERDLLTSTQKLNRLKAKEKYSSILEKMLSHQS